MLRLMVRPTGLRGLRRSISPYPPIVGLLILLVITINARHASSLEGRWVTDPDSARFLRQAEMIARDLHARLEYTWWQERRGFVRNTLNADRCDAIFGIPVGVDMATLTRPYYRSTYVFVSRPERQPAISSLFDERLAHLRIGVHLTGDDYAPPVRALAGHVPSPRMISGIPPESPVEYLALGRVWDTADRRRRSADAKRPSIRFPPC